jgi:DNA-binding NtrC family response regulator
MTAWGSVEGAVEAMRRGARDYIEKPWDNERLITMIRTQVELGRALRRSQRLESENRHLKGEGVPELIAGSKAMQPVLDIIERVGPSDANVLIVGEHGTGKEVVARWLHHVSKRSKQALVAVNAGGFSEGVFESELFGHVKGAFTDAKTDRVGCFELADGGTLFLDEIANVQPTQQAKLLRVLETGEVQRVGSSKIHRVDTRVLSATNANLGEAVACGEFREDLLYRLNTVEIRVPPLRERREDVPLLAQHFLERAARRYGRELEGFSQAAMDALIRHSWPGNVRELQHAVERSVLMARGGRIEASDLGLRRREDGSVLMEELTLDEAERLLIEKALERSQGNVSKAAEALGLSRSALYRRLQRHELGPSGS